MANRTETASVGIGVITVPTYKQQAYELIKDAILYHKLKLGTVYSQDGICAELGISRTPVREALLELQKEGYISFMRGKGIEIAPLSRKAAEDIVEVRGLIELEGCRLAAHRVLPEQLLQMQKNLDQMRLQGGVADAAAMYKLDRRFHIEIFKATNNERLLQIIEQLRDQFLRIESLDAFSSKEKCMQVAEEHEKIYHAIAGRQPDDAVLAMQEHLQKTFDRTVKSAMDSRTI